LEYGASAVFPCGQSRPSIQAAALPHNSISAEHGSSTRPRPIGATDRRTTARAESFVCGSVPVWATLGCRPANGQRQLAGERVPGAIRLRMPDLPRFSAILLRRDRRPASVSTRGCAGDASTIWLTPNVRLADARIAFCWVGMSLVFRGTATCCSPTPGPSPATMLVVFGGADLAGEGGVFVGAVPGVGTGGANPGLW
jgi:hypothetical protein